MEQRVKRAKRKRTGEAAVSPIISQIELARLGGGQVAYIKELTCTKWRSRGSMSSPSTTP
jgi:hypothetical protein